MLPTDALSAILAPLLIRLGPERAQVARYAIDETIATVAPIVDLWTAEARVYEARARLGADSAASATETADRVGAALTRAVEREAERWRRISEVALTASAATVGDELVSALALDGPVADAEAFDALMRDPNGSLVLGHRRSRRRDPKDLSQVARRVASTPTDCASEWASSGEPCRADRVLNSGSCGVCVRSRDGDAVLLGDGTALTVHAGAYERRPAAEFAEDRIVSVFRLASGAPTELLPWARGALASCLASRGTASPGDGRALATRVLFGGIVGDDSTPTKVAARIGRLLRDLREIEGSTDASAILIELAALIFKVHVGLGPPPAGLGAQREGWPIDVGRVRWCRLSDAPVFWLPLSTRDPDQVGGSDMPWTRDIPSAAARWHAESPSLGLDPEWHARIVVLPGQANLWCVDPDHGWWNLDADFDSVLRARRRHLEPWFAALDAIGVLPASSFTAQTASLPR